MTNWSMMRPGGVASTSAPVSQIGSNIKATPDTDTSGRLSQKEAVKRMAQPENNNAAFQQPQQQQQNPPQMGQMPQQPNNGYAQPQNQQPMNNGFSQAHGQPQMNGGFGQTQNQPQMNGTIPNPMSNGFNHNQNHQQINGAMNQPQMNNGFNSNQNLPQTNGTNNQQPTEPQNNGGLNGNQQNSGGNRAKSPSQDKNSQDGIELFCAGIPDDLTRDGLKNLFLEKVDEVKSIRLVENKKDPSRGKLGFVMVANARMAEIAIRELHNYSVGGKKILVKVNEKRPDRDQPRSPVGNPNFENTVTEMKNKMDSNHAAAVNGIANAMNGQSISPAPETNGNNPYSNYRSGPTALQQPAASTQDNDQNQALYVCFAQNCKNQPEFQCKVCNSVSYCSLNCQLSDWQNHHIMCIENVKSKPQSNGQAKPAFQSKVDIKPAIPAPNLTKLGPIVKLSENDLKVLEAFIVHSDANMFWIQLTSSSDEFAKLHQEIQNEFATLDKQINCNYVPKINDLVLAPFMEEQHRAIVTSMQDQKCQVLFIDYGNSEFIEIGKVYQMPESLATKPQFTLMASTVLSSQHKLAALEPYSKLSFFDPVVIGSSIIGARSIKIEQS